MGTRVLFVTGNEILARGLEPLLLREPGVRSFTRAHDGEQAIRTLAEARLDVAVVSDGDGLDAMDSVDLIGQCRRSSRPVRCVALIARPTRSGIERLMQAGAAGLVSTRNSIRSLGEAIRRVHAGGCYVGADITRLLVSGPTLSKTAPGPDATLLTARERDVLRLIAEGWSSREIADRFGISTRTVETHRGHVMKKLQVKKTAALVRFAVREGLVDG